MSSILLYSIYSVSFSQFLSFSLSLFCKLFIVYFIFQNWFFYFLFLFPSLFIIHCSFLFFVHYFHRNLFPNFVIYLVLSIFFIPFSSCLFAIVSVLILLLLWLHSDTHNGHPKEHARVFLYLLQLHLRNSLNIYQRSEMNGTHFWIKD